MGKKTGTLIAFEGISASGKSFYIDKVKQILDKLGYHVVVIEWNSNSLIRQITKTLDTLNLLLPQVYSTLQMISFLSVYMVKYLFYLRKDYIVIADRYLMTSMARDLSNNLGSPLCRYFYHFFRRPDMTIFIDTPIKTCVWRIQHRKKHLLHLNREIKKSSSIENKDLFYLRLQRRVYLLLLNDKKLNANSFVVFFNPDQHKISDIIKTIFAHITIKHIDIKEPEEHEIFKEIDARILIKKKEEFELLWKKQI
jgi:dTMP kinase